MIVYDDVIKFYKDKRNIVTHRNKETNKSLESCLQVANAFYYENKNKNTDDYQFAREIKKRVKEGTLTELATFNYFTEEEASKLVQSGYELQINNGKEEIAISQKWHLYVSYFAYKELKAKLNTTWNVTAVSGFDFCNKEFRINSFKEIEFIKWLIEEAIGEEYLSDLSDRVKSSKEEIKLIKEMNLISKVEEMIKNN